MSVSLLASCGILGLRHALDADHLAAIGTLLASGQSWRRAALLGAAWGIGHGLAVFAAGLVLLALGIQMPASLAVLFDLGVVVMLSVLGLRAMVQGRASPAQGAPHAHALRSPLGSLGIGLVHGASGTAALTLIVLTTLPSRMDGVYFLAIFGLGATVGMTALSALLAWPLRAASTRWQAAPRALNVTAGLLSIAAAVLVLVGTFQPDS